MKALINETLTELSLATIRENNTFTPRSNLFYEEDSPRIDFNGFHCPTDYDNHCNHLFVNIKIGIESVNLPLEQLAVELKDLHFEIKDFKKRMFPDDDLIFVFERVKPAKSSKFQRLGPELLRNKISIYLKIQIRLVSRLEAFILHHLRKIRLKPINSYQPLPPLFPDAFDSSKVERLGFSHLRVYNKHSGTTVLSFNGSKVDFEVFIHMVHHSKLLVHANGKSATKPELRELFSLIGNFNAAKNPKSTLNKVKDRADANENIYTRILSAYQTFKDEL